MKRGSNLLYEGVPEVLSSLKKEGRLQVLRRLQTPVEVKSTIAFLSDWAIIAFAVSIASISFFPFGVISILLIGSRQRALSNLVHDASHGNLFSNQNVNDWVANYFGAFAMFDTVQTYRDSHLNHHRYLGSDRDPDSKNHLRYGYDDQKPLSGPWHKVLFSLLTNPYAFRDSVLGSLVSLSLQDRLAIAIWWTVVVLSVGILFGFNVALCFIGLWLFSRATSYHAIRLFAEFLDHAGLPPNAILKFTRNLPHAGVFARVFHPHEDTYHLVHHLLPKVPHYHLKHVHALLGTSQRYNNAHHCGGYFAGSHSAVLCWAGKCREGAL